MGALPVAGVVGSTTVEAAEGIRAGRSSMVRKTTLEAQRGSRPADLRGVAEPEAHGAVKGSGEFFLNANAGTSEPNKRGERLLVEGKFGHLDRGLRSEGRLLEDDYRINRVALIGEHLTDGSSNKVISGTRAREKLVDKDSASPLVKFVLVRRSNRDRTKGFETKEFLGTGFGSSMDHNFHAGISNMEVRGVLGKSFFEGAVSVQSTDLGALVGA